MKYKIEHKFVASLMGILSLGSATNYSTVAFADSSPVGVVESWGRGPSPSLENTGFGLTYGNWSARWWEWLLSIPKATNPNYAKGKVDCALGQVGDVWYLAGTFGGAAHRSCDIPQGKALFFPLVNVVNMKPGENETLNDLRQQAAAFIDAQPLASLKCTIDGVPCAFDFKRYRATSPAFTIIPPKDGVVPAEYFTARPDVVSDGYWMLLKPLEPRTAPYVIRFGGGTGDSNVDVTYRIVVKR